MFGGIYHDYGGSSLAFEAQSGAWCLLERIDSFVSFDSSYGDLCPFCFILI